MHYVKKFAPIYLAIGGAYAAYGLLLNGKSLGLDTAKDVGLWPLRIVGVM